MRTLILFALIICFALAGCSSGANSPESPDINVPSAERQPSSHYCWGLWEGRIDADAQSVEVTPVRTAEFHLNALPFLEPPPLLYLSLESLEFNGDIIEVGIGLRHPFLGLTEFTGFDVCGIFISNGSVSGYSDPGIVMAGEDDTRLLNPDGYSRWWNPAEFPTTTGTIFGYNDGLLGTPDSMGNFSATLNGYKYFCDDLDDPDDPLTDIGIEGRGMFSAGQKNVRHYTIQMGNDGLVFNYAVDANWIFPSGDPPYTAPDDFGPEANRVEPYRVNVSEIENTLYNDGETSGGALSLAVDVYDWQNADMNTIRVESPGNFAMTESTTVIGGGEGYSTYQVDITGATPAAGEIGLLVSAISEQADFDGYLTGVNTAAYFGYTAEVGGETPVQYHWELDSGGLIYDLYLHDDLSPAITWETDDQLRVYWTADSVPGQAYHPHGQAQGIRSDDGGVNWTDFSQYWGHGNDGCLDHAKITPGDNGNSFGIHPLSRPGGTPSLPHYWAGASTNWDMGYTWGFTMLPYEDCGEVVCPDDGHLHTFGDRKDGSNSGIFQQVCNQTYTFYNDWTGWPDPENVPWPSMWWPLDIYQVADAPARISDTRSACDDSTGALYIAYWGGGGAAFIKVARSTDGSTGLEWQHTDVFDGAGYSDVRDPGIDVDANDRVHLAFLRHNDTTDEDEICYTYSTDYAASWSTIQVLYSTSEYLTDTPVVAYEVIGAQVVAIAFEEYESTWFISSFDYGQTWNEPILFGYEGGSSDRMPDMIEGTDGKLHFVFSHKDATDYDLHFRNAELVEN